MKQVPIKDEAVEIRAKDEDPERARE